MMGPTHDSDKIIARWLDIAEHGDAECLCVLIEKLHVQSELKCPELVPPLVARIVSQDEPILLMGMPHRVSLQLFLDRHPTETMFAYMSFLSHDPGSGTYITALRALTQMALRVGLPNQNALPVILTSLEEARKARGVDDHGFEEDIHELAEMTEWQRLRVGSEVMSYDPDGRLRQIYDEQTGSRTELVYNGAGSESCATVTAHSSIEFSNCEHNPLDGLDFGFCEFRTASKEPQGG